MNVFSNGSSIWSEGRVTGVIIGSMYIRECAGRPKKRLIE